jgi:hypothetical protein
MAEEHDIGHKEEMDHDALLEHLRNYNPTTGNWNKYMHVEKSDWWWDAGAYVHVGFLIFWCLWNMYVDGYVTQAQFSLNHIITYVWIMMSACYSWAIVIIDFRPGGTGVGG